MQKFAYAALVTVGVTIAAAAPAAAFGDRCYAPVSASARDHGQRTTMHHAIRHWQKAVQSQHGARAADWYYSGDRTISCTWDAPGRHFNCVARAIPCERGRG